MKKIISLLLTVLMLAGVISASVVTSNATGDPADSYTVQTAPNEDPEIQMWFNHANVKVHQEDTTPSGKNTYSIYMAKNEYQGANVTLYSPENDKTLITAEIGTFEAMDPDNSGATMAAELFYEGYIVCNNLDTTDVLGVDDPQESFIRNGAIPDALFEIDDICYNRDNEAHFTLTAGRTQTLYIKVKSELDTPSGWYSAQFNVLDSAGNVIKTATVYAYVWDFEIPEANHYQTAIFIGASGTVNNDVYKLYYDYLLDNRICAMDPPGGLIVKDENDEYIPSPYLTNPRVTTFRVGERNLNLQNLLDSTQVSSIYDVLSVSDEWVNIKDKAFFYACDEPRSQQQKAAAHDAVVAGVQGAKELGNLTVDQVLARANICAGLWDGAWSLVAFDENHPYVSADDPLYDRNYSTRGGYSPALVNDPARFNYNDAVQGLMSNSNLNLWCNKLDVYTPRSVILSVGYDGTRRTTKVKNMNGIISGFDCTSAEGRYFDWDARYGKTFPERFSEYQTAKAAEDVTIKHWIYQCGQGPDYTYCNHTIANTGLQTELMFWQSMQVGATGYLYYDSVEYGSTSCDGSNWNFDGKMWSETGNGQVRWKPHVQTTDGGSGNTVTYYGNGVLFYNNRSSMRAGGNPAKEGGSARPIGTIRVEQMRDGIEDYEMLYMYGEIYGETAKQEFISRVSNNVVDYLSMPSFNRSDYDPSMTDEDIFAQVRIELGNAVEEGSNEQPHEHSWDEGVVTTEPTYKTTGIKTYTCTECGATLSEEIPVLRPMIGDVNGDRSLDAKDVRAMKQYISSAITINDIVAVNSNVYADDAIDAKDLKALKILVAGG